MQLLEAADAHQAREAADAAPRRQVPGLPRVPPRAEGVESRDRDPRSGILLIGLGVGGGVFKFLTGKGAAVKATAAATAGVAVVGVAVIGTQVFGPGDPRRCRSRARPSRPDGSRRSSPCRRTRRSSARRSRSPRAAASARRLSSPARPACASPICCRRRARSCASPIRARRSSARAASRGQLVRPGAGELDARDRLGSLPRADCGGLDPRRRPALGEHADAPRTRARRAAARAPGRRGERLGSPGAAGHGRAHAGVWSHVVTDSGRRGWLRRASSRRFSADSSTADFAALTERRK